MKTLTIKEFVADSEGIIRRVEKGEKIAVTDGEVSAVLVSSDEYFYDLHPDIHREFATKSINYAYPDGYENERQKEIRELKEQIEQTQEQIDSIENHHFFIRNTTMLMDSQFKNQANTKINEGGGVYFMHSNKKREITS